MSLSLRNRIVLPTCGLVFIIVLTIGITAHIKSGSLIMDMLDDQLSGVCDTGISEIERWMVLQKNNVICWAKDPSIVEVLGDDVTNESKKSIRDVFLHVKNTYGLESMCVAHSDGVIALSDAPEIEGKINISSRSYFQDALKGNVSVSDVIISQRTGMPIVAIAVPVKDKGKFIGVLLSVLNLSNVSKQVVDPISVFDSGYAFLVDKSGNAMAHPNKDLIMKLKMGNMDWGKKMMSMGSGRLEYVYDGVRKILIFRKSNTLGWTIAVNAPVTEVNAPLRAMGYSIIVIGIVSIVLGLVIALVLARMISNPLKNVASKLLANSNQTAGSANEISSTSQLLASGANEQAASLEETSAALEEVSAMSGQNSQDAQLAAQYSGEARKSAESGADNMLQMGNAMNDIKGSSDEIKKIVKTIDEIAFQTNILALNAAVEAARAGDAGAGFAVVAEEVRALAQRSADAARETAEMVDQAIQKAENGVHLSDQVGSVLSDIVEKIRKVDELVAQVMNASSEQGEGISQVTTAVASMNVVTQQNASSAEESSAAAEELNAQAKALEHVVGDLTALINGSGSTDGSFAHVELNKEQGGNSHADSSSIRKLL